MLKNSKILITGGAGFIGSHIATKLAEDNEIVIFDIFSTGKQENIAHLEQNKNVKIIKVDVRNKEEVNKYMNMGFDYIFHLAAQPSVPQSVMDPQETVDHNINGTLTILQAAVEHGKPKVILSSSAAVYGDDPTLPKRESMQTKPISPYAITKIAGEQFCQAFYELFNLPTVSLRYFNVFGPRQDPNSDYAAVVPKFIERITSGKSPIIFGDGNQSRDFIYIDDVVDANIQAALSNNANGKIFNIAHGKSTTVNELAKIIITFGDATNLEPEYQPPRPGDIIHSYADISEAKSFLNWAPKTDIQDGLKKTYEFFKN